MKTALAALLILAATPLISGQLAAQTMTSSLNGVYTQAQADRGHQLYGFRCARCHDTGFNGAPHLGDTRFTTDFLGRSVFDMADLIHTSMPVDQPGTTSKADAADLSAYILSLMGAPPGGNELPAEDAALQMIRIDVPK